MQLEVRILNLWLFSVEFYEKGFLHGCIASIRSAWNPKFSTFKLFYCHLVWQSLSGITIDLYVLRIMQVVAQECIVVVDLTKVFWCLPCIMQVVPHDWVISWRVWITCTHVYTFLTLLDIDEFDLVRHLRGKKNAKHGEVLTQSHV